MAAPTIPNGEEHFFPIIYEGNGAGQRVGKFVPFTDSGTIANSVIYNRADTPKLSRTPSSDGNRRTFTISFWYKPTDSGTRRFTFSADTDTSNYFIFEFDTSNRIDIQEYLGPTLRLQTTRTFEDTSKFYHFMLAVDTTQSTSSDRLKLYVDGDQITSFGVETYPSLNLETKVNSTSYPMGVGSFTSSTSFCTGGYLAEYNFVDGTALTPSTFGVTDTSTGRWIPKTLTGITYGTNGFRLQFGSSSALGDDTSGNTNDFSVANLVAGDQTTDSPTQNHAILSANPTSGTATLSEGNLKIAGTGSSVYGVRRATFLINSNDSNGYYFEAKNVGSSTDNINIGLISSQNALSASAYGGSNSYGIASRGSGGSNQYWRVLGGSTDVTTSVSHASNDVIGVAIKQGKIWFAINNTWVLSGDPANGTNSFFDMSSKAGEFQIAFNVFQNNTLDVNFGQKSFTYTPPTGFVALQQDNLPETAKGVSGFTWLKDRDNSTNHYLVDSSRNYKNALYSNATNAEVFLTAGLRNPLKGGFEVLDGNPVNGSGRSFVAWNWVANGGTTASNSNGSITSVVQANQTAGFSIVQYTGTGSAGTVGHGLSKKLDWVMVKSRSNDTGDGFGIYHSGMTSASYYLALNSTNEERNASVVWNGTAPTSSVFSIGTATGTNTSSATYIAYCWHGVDGFSKFGKYVGNGSASDGPFIYTGFKPAWVMWKATDAEGWYIYDTTRNTYNGLGFLLRPDVSNADYNYGISEGIISLSNGFKVYGNSGWHNTSGQDYIYMAFAEHPFVGDGTNPVTAR